MCCGSLRAARRLPARAFTRNKVRREIFEAGDVCCVVPLLFIYAKRATKEVGSTFCPKKLTTACCAHARPLLGRTSHYFWPLCLRSKKGLIILPPQNRSYAKFKYVFPEILGVVVKGLGFVNRTSQSSNRVTPLPPLPCSRNIDRLRRTQAWALSVWLKNFKNAFLRTKPSSPPMI